MPLDAMTTPCKQVVAGVIKTLLILAVATDTGMQFQVSQLQVSADSAQ